VKKIKILIPVYNDWQSVFKLLENIDSEVKYWDAEVSVLIVNDASTIKKPVKTFTFKKLKSVAVVNMKKNNGHARSIALGLKYLSNDGDFDYIVPLDGDGEDRPEELGLLFDKAKKNFNKVVVAERIKRSEGFLFRFCYIIHVYLTFIFTGKLIKFGNYTFLPKTFVVEIIKDPALWNSFAGTITKLAKTKVSIPSIRGGRYFGVSKMNFINLARHSLSMISVFKKILLIRSIFFLISYIFLIAGSFSVITLIPAVAVIIMMISVIILSRRENMFAFSNSLENIDSIDEIN
jgi:hypothetical protein